MAKTTAQRRQAELQRQRRRSRLPERAPRDITDQETAAGEFWTPDSPNLNGVVEGSTFEWNAGLFFDPTTGAYYDRGQYEARDLAEMLRVNGTSRKLEAVLTLPLRQAGWKLTPGKGDTGEAQQTEEQLRRAQHMGGMTTPIADVLGQMTSACLYRRSFHAKGFMPDPTRDDDTVMYSQLAYRPASTCRLVLGPNGAYAGFEQDLAIYATTRQIRRANGKPVPFKPSQAVVYIHGAHRDPIGGVSDLEVAYWCWKTQQKILRLWLDYLAGQALPRTIVKHNGDEPKAKAAARQIARLRSSGVGYIDMQTLELDVMDVSGKGSVPFMEALHYLESTASGSILAGFMDLTGAAAGVHGQARGSNALSKNQSDFFLQSREAVSSEMAAALTTQVVAPLVRLNYGRRGVCPTWTFDPLSGVDEGPIMTLLGQLAASPTAPIPSEFIAEIVIEAARILSLDVDKVTNAVRKAQADAEQAARAAGATQTGQQVAGVAGATNKLTKIARKATAAA